jgi:glucosamine--fructose-6-phosphate aminotransferase (isomerizing)
MCGIFGAIFLKPLGRAGWSLEPFVNDALKAAEWRGKDAVGVAIVRPNRIDVLKRPLRVRAFIRTPEYQELMREAEFDRQSLIAVMGHSRLSTNGTEELHENNQPVITQSSALIHNGIIVNAHELCAQNRDIFQEEPELDSKVISQLLDAGLARGAGLMEVLQDVYRALRGQACVAFAHNTIPGLVLFTNNGSLHYYYDDISGVLVFASENVMLRRMLRSANAPCSANEVAIRKCQPGDVVVAGRDLGVHTQSLIRPKEGDNLVIHRSAPSIVIDRIPQTPYGSQHVAAPRTVPRNSAEGLFIFNPQEILALRRCSRCILPASFPGISFDDSGVCSMCRGYSPLHTRGCEALIEVLSRESSSGKPGRCLVALSGGRDSCFMLHYLKRELGLDVVAFTYDWGMVTDLARRNMSRMVSALGVEHILVSADIRRKRDNIRLNVEAWLRRPHPGTIPLFMAGDKQFFFYANKAARDTGSQHLIFGMNRLETTHFKTGFCGVFTSGNANTHFQLSWAGKAKLLSFYGREMILNPRLINRSWLDTLFGFASYYVFPHRYQQFFDYHSWNEKEVNETICSLYDWELAPDTTSTWRIGDGTASFYNYAYLTLTGLTEVDAFRSNQIRQGQLTRSQALEIMLEENRPRVDSFRWYCDAIKVDYRNAARQINQYAGAFIRTN